MMTAQSLPVFQGQTVPLQTCWLWKAQEVTPALADLPEETGRCVRGQRQPLHIPELLLATKAAGCQLC